MKKINQLKFNQQKFNHQRYSLIKQFLPRYLLVWFLFGLSISILSMINIENFNLLTNNTLAFFGVGTFLLAISKSLDGLSFTLATNAKLSKSPLVINLPKLLNFRSESSITFVVPNNLKITKHHAAYVATDHKAIMDKLGVSVKILDHYGELISYSISWFEGNQTYLSINFTKRSDAKRAKRVIITSTKEVVTDITYNNNVLNK
ncbi:hypothetical protein LMH73_018465 [Vibrio splendidus]|nr:hypothetical protein [Vibrio splendidus]MCC4880329.1 hypothetical protein [Vibrio splendidus]